MSRHFRPWKIAQTQLLPSAFVDYVPADHLAQFVVALAREHLARIMRGRLANVA
jgi:hypothetical protein